MKPKHDEELHSGGQHVSRIPSAIAKLDAANTKVIDDEVFKWLIMTPCERSESF